MLAPLYVRPLTDAERAVLEQGLHLSDLMKPARPRQRRTKSTAKPQELSAAPVDKAAVLAMVDQLVAENETAQKQAVLAIAHSENVTDWTEAIAQWLQTASDRPVSIAELSRNLNMSWVKVWLGVMFGNFQLEQRGEFYHSPIWVECFGEQAVLSRGTLGSNP